MQCPKCHQSLQGVDYEGVHIEVCPHCQGHWLDSTELKNILHARQHRFTEQECIAAANATKITGVKLKDLDRHLTCPKCGGTTHPINYGDDTGIIIDKCAACSGMWLDHGELIKIEEIVEGWDDELPDDLAKYGSKLRQIQVDEDASLNVHISHFKFINSLINGILDVANV